MGQPYEVVVGFSAFSSTVQQRLKRRNQVDMSPSAKGLVGTAGDMLEPEVVATGC